jgi:hypothetical protein
VTVTTASRLVTVDERVMVAVEVVLGVIVVVTRETTARMQSALLIASETAPGRVAMMARPQLSLHCARCSRTAALAAPATQMERRMPNFILARVMIILVIV